jgi:hypothetical protein
VVAVTKRAASKATAKLTIQYEACDQLT